MESGSGSELHKEPWEAFQAVEMLKLQDQEKLDVFVYLKDSQIARQPEPDSLMLSNEPDEIGKAR